MNTDGTLTDQNTAPAAPATSKTRTKTKTATKKTTTKESTPRPQAKRSAKESTAKALAPKVARQPVEPVPYRMTVTYTDTSIEFVVETNTTFPAEKPEWLVSQRWQIPAVPAADRRAAVAVAARDQGWMMPDGRWPAMRKGHRQVFTEGIWILDHRLVVAGVTQLREQISSELALVEEAWRRAIRTAVVTGGHTQSEVAVAAHVSQPRVGQMLSTKGR